MKINILCAAFVFLFAGCSDSGSDRLVSAGGLPVQLQKVTCNANFDDLIRAYPDLSPEGDASSYCTEIEKVGKVCAMVLDKKVAGGAVWFAPPLGFKGASGFRVAPRRAA